MEICDYSTVPPGFRFHPTEEELVGYYLKRKMEALKIDLDVITDIDLYKMEPWDIEERCKLGYEEQTEWYFFSHKDRKYPTGTRTNRATAAGFWKATGRDKAVLSSNKLIGMRKTLVFYKGRAPNGHKTDWIMHEYRLQSSHHAPTKEEGWVVCRAFRKPIPNQRPAMDLAAWNHLHACYNLKHDDYCNNWPPPPPPPHHHHFHASASAASSDQVQLIMAPGAASCTTTTTASTHDNSSCLMENPPLLMELPQLHSPTTTTTHDLLTNVPAGHHVEDNCDQHQNNNNNSTRSSSIIDWRSLDSLLSANTTSYDDPFLGCFTSNS